MEYIKNSTKFVRHKVQSPDLFAGYSGTIGNFKTQNGIAGEIQFITDKMTYAKERPREAIRIIGKKRWNEIRRETGAEGGLGHKYYEEMRALNRRVPAQNELWLKLNEESKKYYIHFK